MRVSRSVEYHDAEIKSELKHSNPEEAARPMVIRYEEEAAEDSQLREIKKFCFGYFAKVDLEDEYTLDEISDMQEFVFEKYAEITDLKDRLKLGKHGGQIKSIAYNVDMATLSGSLDAANKDTYRVCLSKETDTILETLGLLSAILDNIIEDAVRTSLKEREPDPLADIQPITENYHEITQEA